MTDHLSSWTKFFWNTAIPFIYVFPISAFLLHSKLEYLKQRPFSLQAYNVYYFSLEKQKKKFVDLLLNSDMITYLIKMLQCFSVTIGKSPSSLKLLFGTSYLLLPTSSTLSLAIDKQTPTILNLSQFLKYIIFSYKAAHAINPSLNIFASTWMTSTH